MALGQAFGLSDLTFKQIDANHTSSDVVTNFAYCGGQLYSPSSIAYSYIYRLDLSCDTWVKPQANMAQALSYPLPMGNGQEIGYWAKGSTGGPSGPWSSDILRIDFATETSDDTGSNCPFDSVYGAAVSSWNYGYMLGGRVAPGDTCSSDVDRLEFSTVTASLISSNHPQNGIRGIASGSAGQAGYFFGGMMSPGSSDTSLGCRLDFTTDAMSTKTGYDRSQTVRNSSATMDYGNNLYISTGNSASNIDRLDAQTETMTHTSQNLVTGECYPASTKDEGYFMQFHNELDKLEHSSCTHIVTPNGLHTVNHNPAPTSYGTGTITSGYKRLKRKGYNNEYTTASYREDSQAGYAALGSTPGGDSSQIYRYDFATESASRSTFANRSETNRDLAKAVFNNEYGYFGGGQSSPPATKHSNIDRLEYVSETVGQAGKFHEFANDSMTGMTDKKRGKGYWIGGGTANRWRSNYQRFDMHTETTGTWLRSTVFTQSNNANSLSRGSNSLEDPSSEFGYMMGTAIPGTASVGERMEFVTETLTQTNPMSQDNGYSFGSEGSRTDGYIASGMNSPSGNNTNKTDKLDFANETWRLTGNNTNTSVRVHGGAQTGSHIFKMCGYKTYPTPATTCCKVDRMDMTTDTWSLPGQNFDVAFSGFAGMHGGAALKAIAKSSHADSTMGIDTRGRQSRSSFGYIMGGSPNRNYIERFNMATEIYECPNSVGHYPWYNAAPMGQSSQGGTISNKFHGYYTAFQTPTTGPGGQSDIHRLDFSNEGWIKLPAQLTEQKVRPGGFMNNSYGYIVAGSSPGGYTSTINRLDFSNETIASPGAIENGNRSRLNTGHIQNTYYGWVMGSYAANCRVDRLEFSTETATADTGMPVAKNFLSGWTHTPADQAVYTMGGTPAGYDSVIYRFDFSTSVHSDTGNDSVYNHSGSAAFQNEEFGYAHGGGATTTNASRVEFANNTSSATSKNLVSGSSATAMEN